MALSNLSGWNEEGVKMTQTERRIFLLRALLHERPEYSALNIPLKEQEQKVLLRSLFNVRPPQPVETEFLEIQDAYLQEEIARKGITDWRCLRPVQEGIYLWKGDITTLRCGAIVNAANRQMLGCFYPNHGCIDNAIHTYAGVQLRLTCWEIMKNQGHEEETGKAKITSAFNLPCDFILHTVGPIVQGRLTEKEKSQLACCYRSCLELADQNQIQSIALCCISTGEFHFPPDQAAQIAVQTVREYKEQTHSNMEVIFNVFKERDDIIYRALLSADS